MKRGMTISVVMFLILSVSISSILGCCMVRSAEAAVNMSKCHTGSQQSNTTQHNKECDCQQHIAVIQEKVHFAIKDHVAVMTLADLIEQHVLSIFSNQTTNHSPPLTEAPIPIYIQHSNLRI